MAFWPSAASAPCDVALTCDRNSPELRFGPIREHFDDRVRVVLEIPFDPHLRSGSRIELDELRRETRDAFLTMAAAVADGFDRTVAQPDLLTEDAG